MAKAVLGSAAEIVLAARVARLYFLEDKSKVDIASELGISRFRAARLLDLARSSGMVRVEIGIPGTLDAGLSAELASAFGLKQAFVYDFPDDTDASLRHRLAEAAGEVLRGLLGPGDVLGIAWSRSLANLVQSVNGFPPCPIVQMTGALSAPGSDDLLDLVRSVTRLGGGPSFGFYAPMIVEDAATAEAIRRHRDVTAALDMLPSVTIGMVGIGAWTAGLSSIYDALDSEREELAAAGVSAEVSGVFLDAAGAPCPTGLDQRMIVTSASVLRQIPTVLAVAYGSAKAHAVWAALNGGLVNGLITHTGLARAVLDLPDSGPRGGRVHPTDLAGPTEPIELADPAVPLASATG